MSAGRRSRSLARHAPGTGRYAVARLLEQQVDARLTDLLGMLAACPKAGSPGVYDRCEETYEGLAAA
jgi:hypothetical protein